MASLVGRTLGQYDVIDILGQGGMATVYLGRQSSIDRRVAIKVLPPHPGLDAQLKERFELEARTVGSLQHPNILPLYDYGVQDDILYLVMAYVQGGTLADRLSDGALSLAATNRVLQALASGLDYAHRQGVIHRDIKPANILMSEEHPQLADFGMVKMIASESNLTGTGIVGTPAYMAPEQGQGLDIDARADIYALGVVVYEMLSGEPLYMGDTPMQVILKHIQEPLPDLETALPHVPREIHRVLNRALAKEPEARFQSAKAFAAAFADAVQQSDDTASAMQRDTPARTSAPVSATQSPPETAAFDNATSATNQTQPQTVILRDSVNPLVLLAGFGLIALGIVVVAVLLNNDTPPTLPPTQIASGAALNSDDATLPPDPPTVTAIPPTPTTALPTFGEVRFRSEDSLGDTVVVSVDGIQPPADDATYAAWLLDTDGDATLFLDEIAVDSLGDGTITFTSDDGTMLPATYNAVAITEERDEIEDVPRGTIVYRAELPPQVSTALQAIFVTAEDGINENSLLESVRIEAETALSHSGFAEDASTIGGMLPHAEHTINILRGTQVDHDGNGSAQNPGRSVGVYAMLDAIDETLNAVITLPDASVDLQTNAEFIRVCSANARFWANDIISLEEIVLTGDSREDILEEAQNAHDIAGKILNGVDLNQNGRVEAFEDECGLEQIPEFGLQFARMSIHEADTDE